MLGRFLLFLTVTVVTPTYAHVLNMTDVALRVSEGQAATLEVSIDLGQSGLLTAEQYWRAVSVQKESEQRALLEEALADLENGIVLRANGERIALEKVRWQIDAVSLEAIRNPLTPQMAVLEWVLVRPISAGDSVDLFLAEELSVPWPALLRVDFQSALPVSRLLTNEYRSSGQIRVGQDVEQRQAGPWVALALAFQSLAPGVTWLVVGFQHILPMGLDHIVFVLGLFFLSSGVSGLLAQVTAFTIAHSITLGLATLGWIVVPSSVVEPLIAASIIYIAIDNLYADHLARWRLWVITLFGLLHGLGFAAALDALVLPEETLLTALLLFNTGVELGQLCVLLIAFAGFGWLRRRASYRARVAEPASITIAGVGLYWLLKRMAF